MTEDEQEAKSARFGGGVLMLLPLASGRWALFDSGRELRMVLAEHELADFDCLSKLVALSFEGRRQYEAEAKAEAAGRGREAASDSSAEDLGL